ncbi:MAG: hypothetical protein H7289_07875 [Mucilaginibacter sp.]|nr:hypothetical protein [Mucilaginibacter sp.]
MSEKLNKAREALAEFAGKFAPEFALQGIVKEIDTVNYTVDVEIETDVVYFDCRLRAVVSDKKSIDVLPKMGSKVLLLKISESDYLVLACDEITEYKITVGTAVYKLDATGHVIGKGTETLKKILGDLIDTVLTIGAYKDTASLTQIKQRINNLLK